MSQDASMKMCSLCLSTVDIAMWSTETANICAACLANGIFTVLARLSWEELGPSWASENLSSSQSFYRLYDLSVTWNKLTKPGEENRNEDGIACVACQKTFLKPGFFFSTGYMHSGKGIFCCTDCLKLGLASVSRPFLYNKQPRPEELPDHLLRWNIAGEVFQEDASKAFLRDAPCLDLYSEANKLYQKSGNFWNLARVWAQIGRSLASNRKQTDQEWSRWIKGGIGLGLLMGYSRPVVLAGLCAVSELATEESDRASQHTEEKSTPGQNAVMHILEFTKDSVVDTHGDDPRTFSNYWLEVSCSVFDLYALSGLLRECERVLEVFRRFPEGDLPPLMRWKGELMQADVLALKGSLYESAQLYSAALTEFKNLSSNSGGLNINLVAWKEITEESERLLESSSRAIERARHIIDFLPGVLGGSQRGKMFERTVKALFETCGMEVQHRPSINAGMEEFEVDLLLSERPDSTRLWNGQVVVECKAWGRAISRDAITKLADIKATSGYSNFLLVHHGKVSSGAARVARSRGISLISIQDLLRVVEMVVHSSQERIIAEVRKEMMRIKQSAYHYRYSLARATSFSKEEALALLTEQASKEVFLSLGEIRGNGWMIIEWLAKLAQDLNNMGIADSVMLRFAVSLTAWIRVGRLRTDGDL